MARCATKRRTNSMCSSQVTIINFTVTMTGLEDQLLVDVVKNERPDLEAKKDELVRTVTGHTRTQSE